MNSALEYDNKVLNGDWIACRNIKRACKIDKLCRKKSKLDSYPYYFDKSIANEYLKLAELISPKPLASFQKWYIEIINGYRLKRNPKIRRYNNSIYSTARKNAKSTIASIILVSELFKNESAGLQNKEYYIVASKLSQALLTLRQCKAEVKNLQRFSELARNFKINRKEIYSTATGSMIKALPSRSQSLDGLNSSLIIADETHAYKDSKLLDVLSSSMGQQPNSCLIQTTTAGFNMQGSLRTDWDVAESALKKTKTDTRSFNALFTQDNHKEVVNNPATWVKSNPLLEVQSVNDVMKPYLKQQLQNSMLKDRSNAVLTKNFNLWTQENNDSFLDDPDQWTKNTVKPVDLMNRKNVVIGVDLSRVRDLTAVSFTVPLKNGKYYTDTHAFVATRGGIEHKSKSDRINYLSLERAGLVSICRHDHGLINYDEVSDYIVNLIKRYSWKDPIVSYDPWGASSGLINNLDKHPNIRLMKVSQSVMNLTGTIRWLYRLILEHKLLHKFNLLYNYSFNNLKATYDIHGNLYLNKARSVNKIDPAFALVDSLYIQKSLQQQQSSTLKEELHNNNFIF